MRVSRKYITERAGAAFGSLKRVGVLPAAVGILSSFALASGQQTAYDIPFPAGFRDWLAVNSMLVTRENQPFLPVAGVHSIYVNSKGRPNFEKGGPFPYPDGTVFADDVHEISEMNGAYVAGRKKAVTVMVKDAQKYAATGGWGFQAWVAGDASKTLVHDTAQSVTVCLTCHMPRKENDYVYSTLVP